MANTPADKHGMHRVPDRDPIPIASIDADVSFHRARWIAVGLLFAMMTAGLVILSLVVINQRGRIQSSCDFYRVLGTAPLSTHPVHPTKIGVDLVESSRSAYTGQGCGTLPPPNGTLIFWSVHYNVAVVP